MTYDIQSVMRMPLQEQEIEFVLSDYGRKGQRSVRHILKMPPGIPLPGVRNGGPIYRNLGNVVIQLHGYQKAVMTDLVRKLIFGHFCKIPVEENGEVVGFVDDGRPVNNPDVWRSYPDHKTLQWFARDISTATNTYGLIAYNLVEQESGHLDDPDYRMLGAIFNTLLSRKGLGRPVAFKIELNPAKDSMTCF